MNYFLTRAFERLDSLFALHMILSAFACYIYSLMFDLTSSLEEDGRTKFTTNLELLVQFFIESCRTLRFFANLGQNKPRQCGIVLELLYTKLLALLQLKSFGF